MNPAARPQGIRRALAAGALVSGAGVALGARHRRLGALVAIGGMGVAWATVRPSNPLLGPVASRGRRERPAAALALAVAPTRDTPAVLDALGEAGARATFFVVGEYARNRPDMVRRIHRDGHDLASAGLAARPIAFRGPYGVARDLRATEEIVADALGDDLLTRLFLAPDGIRGVATWVGARHAGYRMVSWSRAVWPAADDGAAAIAHRAVGGMEPGAVVAIGPSARNAAATSALATAVGDICRGARGRGLELVGIGDLLHEPSAD